MNYKLTILFLFFVIGASSQARFASQSMEVLWSKLPANCQKILLTQKECDCQIKGLVYCLKSELDGNRITHLGLKVFNDSVSKANNPFVYRFIERELLQFILNDEQGRNTRQLEDKVYLYYTSNFQKRTVLNNPTLIHNVFSGLSGSTIKQDSLTYKVLLVNHDMERLEIEFPKENALIRGMDKKELDDFIYSELSTNIKDVGKHRGSLINSHLMSEENLLVSVGENYLIKGFNSTTYYKSENNRTAILFQPDRIKESFSNLFLTDLAFNRSTQLDLKISSYGGNDQLLSITISQFLSNFGSDYKLFFGVETAKPDGIRGSLIIYCPSLNYIHLLDLRTTTSSLFNKQSKLNGVLHPYIPSHNIRDLFGIVKVNGPVLDDLINWEIKGMK